MRLVLLLLTGVLLAGCGGARAGRPTRMDIQDAQRLEAEGCFYCLIRARIVYERLLDVPSQRDRAYGRLFETLILLAAREKELGLPAASTLERARQLEPAVPRAALFLRAAELLPFDTAGLSQEALESSRRARPPGEWTAPRDELLALTRPGNADASAGSRRLAAYLAVALTCELDPVRRGEWLTAHQDSLPAGPALEYRLATCGLGDEGRLRTVLERHSRYVEARLFLGRLLQPRREFEARRQAGELLEAAGAALPLSPSVQFTRAEHARTRADFARAVGLYDDVIALVPAHRGAWLGRTIAHTHMRLYSKAIADATRLIGFGGWYVGEAYYYRAWNHYQLEDLSEARADIDQARQRLYSGEVLTLAGLIEYAQKDIPQAKQDFAAAWDLSTLNCTAAWFLGLIAYEASEWPAAGSQFADAMECYRETADQIRTTIEEVRAGDLPEDLKADRIAAEELALAETLVQHGAAAYNAAQAFARAGDRAAAETHATLALDDEQMRPKAEELLRILRRR